MPNSLASPERVLAIYNSQLFRGFPPANPAVFPLWDLVQDQTFWLSDEAVWIIPPNMLTRLPMGCVTAQERNV